MLDEDDIEKLTGAAQTDHRVELYRSALSIVSYLVVLAATVIAIFILEAVIIKFRLHEQFAFLRNFSLRWLSFIPIVILIEFLRQYFNDKYYFDAESVQQKSGRLSFTYLAPVIKYQDIRAIEVRQSVWGRIFDYGDLCLGTAAADDYEIIMRGMDSPYKLANQVEQLRTASESRRGGTTAEGSSSASD